MKSFLLPNRIFPCVDRYITIYLSIHHLACFYFFDIMNNAGLDICPYMNLSTNVFISFGSMSMSEIAVSYNLSFISVPLSIAFAASYKFWYIYFQFH